MSQKPCPKCSHDGIFERIGRFLFFRCFSCGYSITAKHYRAKLEERLPENEIAILEKAFLRDFGRPMPEHLKLARYHN